MDRDVCDSGRETAEIVTVLFEIFSSAETGEEDLRAVKVGQWRIGLTRIYIKF